jgi:proteasome lid subunit RPN8/RPN11
MKKLVLDSNIYPRICALAREYEGEFAVTLFGTIRGDDHIITHIAPPGRKSVNDWAFCTNDQEYEADFFERLREQDPAIQYLGDLHAHPPLMSWLSDTDRRTIRQILLGTTDAIHPNEYVGGVMLRNRHNLDIYPMHFTRENLSGSPMEVQYERVCQKPQRTGGLIHKTYCHCRSWLARQRTRRHGHTGRIGHDHPDRP